MDINSDCGESFGNWKMGADAEVIPRVTSANIACGFHASDPVNMLKTVNLAKRHGTRIGAHPGLPDLLGFGRRRMAISAEDAYAYIVYQAGALQGFLKAQNLTLDYIKPHGSLMSMLMTDDELADAVSRAVADICEKPVIYFTAPLQNAALPKAAARYGVRVVAEVYPDLDYADDGSVIVQREKHHTPIEKATTQLRTFLNEGRVRTTSGNYLPLEAESICVHGDGPNAVELIDALRQTVLDCGIAIAPAL